MVVWYGIRDMQVLQPVETGEPGSALYSGQRGSSSMATWKSFPIFLRANSRRRQRVADWRPIPAPLINHTKTQAADAEAAHGLLPPHFTTTLCSKR